MNQVPVLYTKTICGQCILVKSMLDNKSITYGTINADEQPEVIDVLKAKGAMSMPVLKLSDTEYLTNMSDIMSYIDEL